MLAQRPAARSCRRHPLRRDGPSRRAGLIGSGVCRVRGGPTPLATESAAAGRATRREREPVVQASPTPGVVRLRHRGGGGERPRRCPG
eukprot:scaffold13112_cov62-Isochrysis_galbana.AAC.1